MTGEDFMPEIIRCYRQSVPAQRFIGKTYTDADRSGGSFGAKWGEWFENGYFGILESICDEGLKKTGETEDSGAYIGLMRYGGLKPFEYRIGMFFAENTPVPDGFEAVDFPASDLGTCWIYGKESEGLYGMHDACVRKMTENEFVIRDDLRGGKEGTWFFERYNCPRFTSEDDKGNKILDYCFYINS